MSSYLDQTKTLLTVNLLTHLINKKILALKKTPSALQNDHNIFFKFTWKNSLNGNYILHFKEYNCLILPFILKLVEANRKTLFNSFVAPKYNTNALPNKVLKRQNTHVLIKKNKRIHIKEISLSTRLVWKSIYTNLLKTTKRKNHLTGLKKKNLNLLKYLFFLKKLNKNKNNLLFKQSNKYKLYLFLNKYKFTKKGLNRFNKFYSKKYIKYIKFLKKKKKLSKNLQTSEVYQKISPEKLEKQNHKNSRLKEVKPLEALWKVRFKAVINRLKHKRGNLGRKQRYFIFKNKTSKLIVKNKSKPYKSSLKKVKILSEKKKPVKVFRFLRNKSKEYADLKIKNPELHTMLMGEHKAFKYSTVLAQKNLSKYTKPLTATLIKKYNSRLTKLTNTFKHYLTKLNVNLIKVKKQRLSVGAEVELLKKNKTRNNLKPSPAQYSYFLKILSKTYLQGRATAVRSKKLKRKTNNYKLALEGALGKKSLFFYPTIIRKVKKNLKYRNKNYNKFYYKSMLSKFLFTNFIELYWVRKRLRPIKHKFESVFSSFFFKKFKREMLMYYKVQRHLKPIWNLGNWGFMRKNFKQQNHKKTVKQLIKSNLRKNTTKHSTNLISLKNLSNNKKINNNIIKQLPLFYLTILAKSKKSKSKSKVKIKIKAKIKEMKKSLMRTLRKQTENKTKTVKKLKSIRFKNNVLSFWKKKVKHRRRVIKVFKITRKEKAIDLYSGRKKRRKPTKRTTRKGIKAVIHFKSVRRVIRAYKKVKKIFKNKNKIQFAFNKFTRLKKYLPKLREVLFRRERYWQYRIRGFSVKLKSTRLGVMRGFIKNYKHIKSLNVRHSLKTYKIKLTKTLKNNLFTKKIKIIQKNKKTYKNSSLGFFSKKRFFRLNSTKTYSHVFKKFYRRFRVFKSNRVRYLIKQHTFKFLYNRLARKVWRIRWKNINKKTRYKNTSRALNQLLVRTNMLLDKKYLKIYKRLTHNSVLTNVVKPLIDKKKIWGLKNTTRLGLDNNARSAIIFKRKNFLFFTNKTAYKAHPLTLLVKTSKKSSPTSLLKRKSSLVLFKAISQLFSFNKIKKNKKNTYNAFILPFVRNSKAAKVRQKLIVNRTKLKLKKNAIYNFKKLVLTLGIKKKKEKRKKKLKLPGTRVRYLNFFLQNPNNFKNIDERYKLGINRRLFYRGWLTNADKNNHEQQQAQNVKNRTGYVKALRAKYDADFEIKTKRGFNLKSANSFESYKNYNKALLSKINTREGLFESEFTQERAFSYRNNITDLSTEFLKILWTAQNAFRDLTPRSDSWNRWRFKKKFWEWYAKKTYSEKWEPSLSKFPLLSDSLIKLGFVSSRYYLQNLYKFNFVYLNNHKIQKTDVQLSVGDVVTLPQTLHTVRKINKIVNKRKKKNLKRAQRIQQLIVKSQWRERKYVKPRVFKFFQEYLYSVIPNWMQFDYFASCFSAIKYPNNLTTFKDNTPDETMLLKLTPWRLKI